MRAGGRSRLRGTCPSNSKVGEMRTASEGATRGTARESPGAMLAPKQQEAQALQLPCASPGSSWMSPSAWLSSWWACPRGWPTCPCSSCAWDVAAACCMGDARWDEAQDSCTAAATPCRGSAAITSHSNKVLTHRHMGASIASEHASGSKTVPAEGCAGLPCAQARR